MQQRPNIVLILNDDMGYSDLGCYGGEIDTPNLNSLAEQGLRLTQFYNTARCCPSRACLLTGLHPHQTGIGILTGRDGPDGYEGNLSRNNVTLPEVLTAAGYGAYMSGKWHVCSDQSKPNGSWPLERGFEKYYGIITGGADYFQPKTLYRDHENIDAEAKADPNFYLTDAIADNACRFIREHTSTRRAAPFFLYTAFTSPHWPLCKPKDIEKYKGKFDAGWDRLREARLERMRAMGLLRKEWGLSARDPSQPPWGRRRRIKSGSCAAWKCTRRRSIAWIRASAGCSTRCARRDSLRIH